MNTSVLNIEEIRKILPQKEPFIMIDRVIAYEEGKTLTAVKNITGNEWIFEGRKAGSGTFPETLLIEAASQTALLLYQLSKIKSGEKQPGYILGRIKADFSESFCVGEQLVIKAFANKMLDDGGYSEIELFCGAMSRGKIEIIYKVIR